ncbi:albumin-binding GA domain-containing protein [Streptococcus urinalis]|uniref:Immunoglobulin G-binding protein G n=1 Tax=Streptococcus urinalis 2285-97 TaxID=764291 RepID=G5KGV3_9STRE|nr:albumin-binding GA domain-containing protein [Streptococcus urinalis]EHJ55678.1 putative immunoglobulin G-binding protein G [Streptococcus urinalis 2285-97]VEF31025.1 SzPSe-like cell surface-anchored protein [Streptococcus urinalis]
MCNATIHADATTGLDENTTLTANEASSAEDKFANTWENVANDVAEKDNVDPSKVKDAQFATLEKLKQLGTDVVDPEITRIVNEATDAIFNATSVSAVNQLLNQAVQDVQHVQQELKDKAAVEAKVTSDAENLTKVEAETAIATETERLQDAKVEDITRLYADTSLTDQQKSDFEEKMIEATSIDELTTINSEVEETKLANNASGISDGLNDITGGEVKTVKDYALEDAKSLAKSALKSEGASDFYINKIDSANTVEGVNSLKDSIIESLKASNAEKYNANVLVSYVDTEGNVLRETVAVSQGQKDFDYNTIPLRLDNLTVNGQEYAFKMVQEGSAPEVGTTKEGDTRVVYVYSKVAPMMSLTPAEKVETPTTNAYSLVLDKTGETVALGNFATPKEAKEAALTELAKPFGKYAGYSFDRFVGTRIIAKKAENTVVPETPEMAPKSPETIPPMTLAPAKKADPVIKETK